MADIVTDLVADITTKLESVNGLNKKVIYMFDQNDLLEEEKKIGLPAIGVVYNGMTGGDDAARSGLVTVVVIDIYILGGKQCVEKISKSTGVKITTTGLLEQMRDAIKLTKPLVSATGKLQPRPKGQRIWQFVFETPIQLNNQAISYVQRWKTKVVQTS